MNRDERQLKIESYGRAYEILTGAIKAFPREMWRFQGQNDPWTIHDVMIHIADSEANSYARCRRCIAEPGQWVMAYDENQWVVGLRYADQSADDALELFRWLRHHTYNLIRNLPDEVWAHTIEHPENGTMTLEDWLGIYEDHIPAHVAQMRAIYAEWQVHQST